MKLTPVLIVDAIEPCLLFWVDRLGFTVTVTCTASPFANGAATANSYVLKSTAVIGCSNFGSEAQPTARRRANGASAARKRAEVVSRLGRMRRRIAKRRKLRMEKFTQRSQDEQTEGPSPARVAIRQHMPGAG